MRKMARRRPAAARPGTTACGSYNETCPHCARGTVPVAARGRRATAPGSRSYVFFLPKLNDGLGSELGSGEIWNAEKA